MTLSPNLIERPFAHRGLHDRARGIIENSLSAFEAAVEAGYGIELDVQRSRDGMPVVFHDDVLDRLTDLEGPVSGLTAEQLGTVRLKGSDDVIVPLSDVLARIGGRVPVLVEIKDQRGADGFAEAVGRVIAAAGADLMVMSFNPGYIHALEGLEAPRGLTTAPAEEYGDDLPPETRAALGRIAAWGPGLDFVSHDRRHLSDPRITELKGQGASILCWTVRSAAEAEAAYEMADQITFEGYRP